MNIKKTIDYRKSSPTQCHFYSICSLAEKNECIFDTEELAQKECLEYVNLTHLLENNIKHKITNS